MKRQTFGDAKKHQGTKSREVGHRLSRERYGDLILTPAGMMGPMLAPGNLDGRAQGSLEERNGHFGRRVDSRDQLVDRRGR